jgi:hypothetical protein
MASRVTVQQMQGRRRARPLIYRSLTSRYTVATSTPEPRAGFATSGNAPRLSLSPRCVLPELTVAVIAVLTLGIVWRRWGR